MEREMRIAFVLREIYNQCNLVIHKSLPRFERGPKSQLQGGMLGYLYHHAGEPVYQKDLEKEFRISRATATNTLQVMEREGLIVRRAQDRDARLKRIQMTEEAYQNHRQVEAHMNWMDRHMLEGMSGSEVADLRRLLRIVMRNLEALMAELNEPPGEEGTFLKEGVPPGSKEAALKEGVPPGSKEAALEEGVPPGSKEAALKEGVLPGSKEAALKEGVRTENEEPGCARAAPKVRECSTKESAGQKI